MSQYNHQDGYVNVRDNQMIYTCWQWFRQSMSFKWWFLYI